MGNCWPKNHKIERIRQMSNSRIGNEEIDFPSPIFPPIISPKIQAESHHPFYQIQIDENDDFNLNHKSQFKRIYSPQKFRQVCQLCKLPGDFFTLNNGENGKYCRKCRNFLLGII